MEFWDYSIIFIVTFLVRIIATNTGGGGLAIIPFLIFMGLPPSMAIAANRVSNAVANVPAIIKFHQHGQVKWRLGMTMIIPAALGSLIGSWSVLQFSEATLQTIIGIIILVSVPLLFVKKDFGLHEFTPTRTRIVIGHILAIGGGYLAGLFAATGVWFTFIYVFMGLTFLQTAGTRKISGFIMALLSAIIFIIAGIVDWPVVITMFIAASIGSWVGAHIGVKAGNVWIRRLFALVVIASAIKMLLG